MVWRWLEEISQYSETVQTHWRNSRLLYPLRRPPGKRVWYAGYQLRVAKWSEITARVRNE